MKYSKSVIAKCLTFLYLSKLKLNKKVTITSNGVFVFTFNHREAFTRIHRLTVEGDVLVNSVFLTDKMKSEPLR